MPDVYAAVYEFGDLPVYLRLNLACDMPETYRIQGSKGLHEVGTNSVTFAPQLGIDTSPSYYTGSFPRAMREEYEKKWHQENDAKLEQLADPATSIAITAILRSRPVTTSSCRAAPCGGWTVRRPLRRC